MKYNIENTYQEGYLPTPRCRKIRYRDAKEIISLDVKEISNNDAPVAFIVKEYGSIDSRVDGEYRLYNNQLFKQVMYQDKCCNTEGTLPINKLQYYFRSIYDYWNYHNHGGTGLFVDVFYNSNISKNRYFNALEHEKAIMEADRIAANRGDTNDVGIFIEYPMIKVLIPEAVHCNPQIEHGDGDPFINSLESMINTTDSATEAGFLTMAMALATA